MLTMILLLGTLQPNFSSNPTLTVTITGLKNNDGKVMIQLMDEHKKTVKQAMLNIKNKKAEWIVNDISGGRYAIRLFHDENNNQKMDTNFMGIPKEGYAFSNNAKGTFGPPAHEKTLFDCQTNKAIDIEVVY